MSMLTLIQRFARRTNISVPTSVLGSTDEQVLQAMSLLEEEGNELSTRGNWQELTFEATHTTLATEDQGAIGSIASNGFRDFRPNTFWDRTIQLPVYVINDHDWQSVKAIQVTGPRYQARIRANRLVANPIPAAGNTWAFEYISENWVVDSGGTVYDKWFNADSDEFLLPENILMMGLRWRWKKEKGLDYAEDFITYEKMVAQALAANGINGVIDMSDGPKTPAPAVFIPEGTYNV